MGAFLQRSRHGTIFYFRRKVPVELRDRVRAPQFYLSLGTADRSIALVLARRAATLSDELFHAVKTMPKKKLQADLMQLIELTKATAPLKEEIEQLRNKLADKGYEHKKALRHAGQRVQAIKDEHLRQLASVAGAAPKATSSTTERSKFTVAEAIKKYLTKPMKPTSRARLTPALAHFEKFASATARLETCNQARYAEYSDAVNATVGWAVGTKKLYITAAGTMLRWHTKRGEPIGPITAGTLVLARTTPASWDREAFTLDQLEVVFREAAESFVTEPHWFWAVVAPAFLGCRIEEWAQADVKSDFKKDKATGRWYLDINETVGLGGHKKSVKKESGWRVVPLHPELIRVGLLDYLEKEKRAGARTLFEREWEPLAQKNAPGSFKFSHSMIKRGSRALIRLDKQHKLVKGKTSFFHSLRHSFISQLAVKGVSIEMRCAISGHKPEGGGINSTTYTKLRAQVEPKLAAIDDNLGEFVDRLRSAMKAAGEAVPA